MTRFFFTRNFKCFKIPILKLFRCYRHGHLMVFLGTSWFFLFTEKLWPMRYLSKMMKKRWRRKRYPYNARWLLQQLIKKNSQHFFYKRAQVFMPIDKFSNQKLLSCCILIFDYFELFCIVFGFSSVGHDV